MSQMIWPALAVGYRYSAMATGMTRSAVLEVLREDYVRTARAKGLRENCGRLETCAAKRVVADRYRNRFGIRFLIGGLVVTEQVFNLNGIGMLLVESITHRDYTMTQALVLLVSCAFIAMNFFSTCSMSGSTRESIISETSQRRGRR